MKYISGNQVIAINAAIIKSISPNEPIGVAEHTSLEMTVNLPMATSFGAELYPTLESKVAVILINLVKNHCFLNGNKRTATASTMIFLKINGYGLNLSEDNEMIELVVRIAVWDKSFDTLKSYVENFLRERIELL